jgi:hypothetical protein
MSLLPPTSSSDEKCAGSTQAIDICTIVSNPAEYDGKELVIRGLYRMIIHGSIMTGSTCRKVHVNMRLAYTWKGDKHAQAVLRTQTKKNQYQFVELVIRGIFRVAKQGQCFGQGCFSYEVEESELFCAARSDEK